MIMLPELIVILTGFVILILDLFIAEEQKTLFPLLALGGLLASLVTVFYFFPMGGQLFEGRFVFDNLAGWFKVLFLLASMLTVLLSWDQHHTDTTLSQRHLKNTSEYFLVLLFSLSGMMYLISARDLVTLYISLELATIPLYVLVAWKRHDPLSGEAGLKYVILGILSSAVLLYGVSILYGLSGTTRLSELAIQLELSPAFWFAVALVTAGVGFKVTMVPFHMWAADVYQGAPTPITAHLSVASKSAGLAFMMVLFYRMVGNAFTEWNAFFAVLATLTMTVGNLAAILQKNIKRFMAFSGVSQAGYLFMGFMAPLAEGGPAIIFYLLTYVFSNMVVFAAIVFYINNTGKEAISDYQGLSRSNPLVALAMMIGLFSLAGIPPLSGFVGKFFLFSIAAGAGYHWLVGVAALNSTISLYYYLRIVRQMYIEPSQTESPQPLSVSPILGSTLVFTFVGTVILGIFPIFYESIVLS